MPLFIDAGSLAIFLFFLHLRAFTRGVVLKLSVEDGFINKVRLIHLNPVDCHKEQNKATFRDQL